MPKVNNKKTISNIAKKSFSANKMRNILSIFAIILTTIMLTSLFTIGGSMLKITQESNFRMIGTSAHGGFKYLTQAEYDTLSKHPYIKDISYDIILSIADNPELNKLAVEIRYSEDNNARWGYSYPEVGSLPKEYNEIATSTIVLDELGIPYEIGQEITLAFSVFGKEYNETFVLSGFWEGDPVNFAQQAFLSREYVDSIVETPTISYAQSEDYDFAGTINTNVWFANSFNIENKMYKVLTESGYDINDIGIGVNWGYSFSEIDIVSVLAILGIILVIMASGYLIISNIFYISITKDIKFYGLLKTIGTTSKQIKTIIRKQAFKLCSIAIPLGLVFGYILGILILPKIIDTTIFAGESQASFSIWIFVLSALFSFLTVFISTSSPSRLASKVSPIDAIRTVDINVSTKKKTRKKRKVSVFSLAYQNVFRNKKKLISVVLSLLLSIVLTLSIYTVINSFDMDMYLSNFSVSDFIITNPALAKRFELSYIDESITGDILEIDGSAEIGGVYMLEGFHKLNDVSEKNFEIILNAHGYKLSDYASYNIGEAKGNKKIPTHIYGIDEVMYDNLNFNYGTQFDENKFITGDYIYVSSFLTGDFGNTVKENDDIYSYYNIGDKVTIDFENGNSKDYTVLGYANIPYPVSAMHTHYIESEFILPAEEYLKQTNKTEYIHILFNVEDSAVIEEDIEHFADVNNLSYTSKATLIEEFEGLQMMYVVVGGVLVLILAVIGILNFINSMLTSVITRKVEIATLQSIGMTNKDVRSMLVAEGLIHAGIVILLTLTVGQLLVYLFTQFIAGQVWFFSYNFRILPLAICIPILLILCYTVPNLAFRNIKKESIVQRLRVAE